MINQYRPYLSAGSEFFFPFRYFCFGSVAIWGIIEVTEIVEMDR